MSTPESPPTKEVDKSPNSSHTKQHIVWPQDEFDKSLNAKTTEFLKEGIEQQNIYFFTDRRNDKLVLWLVNVTRAEVDTIRQNLGVNTVQEDRLAVLDDAVVP